MPASICPIKPVEVNGRIKKGVSDIVLASPRLAYGATRCAITFWIALFQSTVARPVLRPLSLSPVGAVPVIVDV